MKEIEVPQFIANVVICRCSNEVKGLQFKRIVSRRYGDYITLSCDACGTQTKLCKTAKTAVNLWNDHFGKGAKKQEVIWDIDDVFKEFI